ncbi:MAG: RdgB/HAM1 family non-canonical purine NTP pyrophosphatase [Proteobacteria bacterium]|nr:RdgB/HAM1 family non-canonical purine NTP pyrophosphatase [Pseudomonadota bacterium]
MIRAVLASSNAGKLRELGALLAPCAIELATQQQLGIAPAEETGDTFLANALLKARHAAAAARRPALADDSGLAVDALDGRPGVRSARYAGAGATDQQNLDKLLEELAGVATARRTARYHCVIVWVRDAADPQPLIAHGTWEGRIAPAPAGSGGFGYDPVFIPAGMTCTAAQLDPQEKNRVSHRAQALRALLAMLRAAGYIAAP